MHNDVKRLLFGSATITGESSTEMADDPEEEVLVGKFLSKRSPYSVDDEEDESTSQ